MLFRMLGAPIGRVKEGDCWRIETAKGSVVAHVSPQSSGPRLSLSKHWHSGVVSVDALGRKYMLLDQDNERH